MTNIAIGIFVGGASKRMGGVAKGLLKAPSSSETLVARLLRICKETAPTAILYLVGQSPLYAGFGLTQLPDDPPEVGPIGGLRSLLLRAEAEKVERALALACDLPFIDAAMLRELGAPLAGSARVPIVAGRLQPLAAAYAPSPSLAAVERALAADKRALMQVLAELGAGVERVEVGEERAAVLRDWDTPGDVTP